MDLIEELSQRVFDTPEELFKRLYDSQEYDLLTDRDKLAMDAIANAYNMGYSAGYMRRVKEEIAYEEDREKRSLMLRLWKAMVSWVKMAISGQGRCK